MAREWFFLLRERFARNDILTYASAMAVQLLTALIPLLLLACLLVGALGKQSVWRQEIGPAFADRASVPTYQAVDAVVEGLISSTHVGWLVAAALIAWWEISGAVRCSMGALNRILELDENRPTLRRFGLSFLLSLAVAVLALGALVVTTRGGGWVDLGPAQFVWAIARWLLDVVLIWLVVGLLIRFAPNGHEPPGWITLGTSGIVLAWLAISAVYGWWVSSVANYTTPFGTMIFLLTLVGYMYVSSIVFLVGAQLDHDLLRRSRRR